MLFSRLQQCRSMFAVMNKIDPKRRIAAAGDKLLAFTGYRIFQLKKKQKTPKQSVSCWSSKACQRTTFICRLGARFRRHTRAIELFVFAELSSTENWKTSIHLCRWSHYSETVFDRVDWYPNYGIKEARLLAYSSVHRELKDWRDLIWFFNVKNIYRELKAMSKPQTAWDIWS